MRGEFDITVYYEDTDALGVVYHANYLKYFERGRSELLARMTGKNIAEINRDGYNIAVYRADVTFRKPARLMERCRVTTEILDKGSPYRLYIAQTLEREGEVLTKGDIELVCLDGNFRLRPFPEHILVARKA